MMQKSKVINVYDGNIYGGSKSSGFSKENYAGSSQIVINVYDGNIGNIYGGSDESGICYGSTILNIQNCNVSGDIYGLFL